MWWGLDWNLHSNLVQLKGFGIHTILILYIYLHSNLVQLKVNGIATWIASLIYLHSNLVQLKEQ